MVTSVVPYVLWLTLVGCLLVAAPVFGVLTLAAALGLVVRSVGKR